MLISQGRRVPSNGATVVAAAIDSTPFIEAWNFDQGSGWGAKYTAPGTTPSITGTGRCVKFGPDNDQLLMGGSTGTAIYNYPFDISKDPTTIVGYGTPATTSYTSPLSLNFNETEDRLLVSGSGVLAEYSYASGAIGSQLWNIPVAGIIRESKYLDFDKYIIVGFTAGSSFYIYDRSTGSPPTTPAQSTLYGTVKQFSLSPQVLTDGSQSLATPHSSGFRMYRITAGAIGAQLSFSPSSSTPEAAIFDPYGRLITYEGSSTGLNIYTQASDGSFTHLDSDTGMDTFGTASYMEYDVDQDILFVGFDTTPFISAIRMGGNGFVSKYTDLTGGNLPTDGVNKIALRYDERFKTFNV